MRDTRQEFIEEEKIELFDRMFDIWMDKELSYQKRAAMICDVLRDYALRRYHG